MRASIEPWQSGVAEQCCRVIPCLSFPACPPTAGASSRGAFRALKGPNFDGHDFVARAAEAGAAAALVSAPGTCEGCRGCWSRTPLTRLETFRPVTGQRGGFPLRP